MNYTQIGNVFRLCIIIEPFAALIWALGIVFAHIQLTQPAGLLHPSTLYTVVLAWYCTVQQGSERFNLREEELATFPFTILLYIIYLCNTL